MSVEGVELPNSEPSSPLSLSCGSTPCKELPPIDYYTIAIMSDSPTDSKCICCKLGYYIIAIMSDSLTEVCCTLGYYILAIMSDSLTEVSVVHLATTSNLSYHV